uniref:Pyridoxal-dependent decarboxylase domain-containing protein 1 n=1 Tax=Cyprinus carpio TaxID=7962 RepID=A0A8C1ISN6_CYPCA
MKILESGKLESEQGKERRKLSWKDIPGPLQGDGQDVVSILQLVQNLMHGDDDQQGQRRMQYVGEQGHMALLGHSLAAYISVLERERLRKLTTRILSDTTLWLCRLFRYENGSAYYHEDDREGLVKVCRLVINTHYEDYATEGFTMLSSKHPVIYQSAACRPGLGQHLCSQLALPLSCLCIVPCNTMFGSLHQMDVALLDKLIRDDRESGKVPLLLIANAGTPGAGHTDKLSRLKELCVQYNMWLHVEGVNLATLALGQVSSAVTAATKCDSMTLTPGPWLGLPAVPAVTLYRHEDPALSLAAGLTSSQPVEKLRALPLWLSLQYLGHDGILQRIKHASQLSQQLLEHLKTLASIKTSVGELLGEQLAQQVPLSGVDVVELEDEGTCVRFSPLMTAAALGTQENDVAALVEKLGEMIPVLSCTLRYRQDFKDEVLQQASLSYIEDLSWPGLGGVRYEPRATDLDEDKRQHSVEKINNDLLKKLMELDTDLYFSGGPEFCEEKNCIFIGMATEDLDVAELVETIVSIGREIEESGKLFENMTEVVRRGIQEAELQLQKANEEKLMEEGVLRQIPLVGPVLNWFSPVQASVKGRTFNLAEGIDVLKGIKCHKVAHSTTCCFGQKLFRRHGAGSDSVSDTSSVSQLEESFRETAHVQANNVDEAEVPEERHVHIVEETALSDQRVPEGQETESVDTLR